LKILAIRTDKPEAELYVLKNEQKLAELKWQAHLKLAETLNSKVEEILNKSSISYENLEGIAIYKGPGSFTGLRIGFSAANSLAYGLGIPVVARGGKDWLEKAGGELAKGKNDKIAVPDYGAPVRTTKPRK
jgi:tRNA threonylcarbamoyladenosine biosynthesis protein TsaB